MCIRDSCRVCGKASRLVLNHAPFPLDCQATRSIERTPRGVGVGKTVGVEVGTRVGVALGEGVELGTGDNVTLGTGVDVALTTKLGVG